MWNVKKLSVYILVFLYQIFLVLMIGAIYLTTERMPLFLSPKAPFYIPFLAILIYPLASLIILAVCYVNYKIYKDGLKKFAVEHWKIDGKDFS